MLLSEVVVLQRFVVQNRVEDFQDSILPQLEEDILDWGDKLVEVDILDSEVDIPDSEGGKPDFERGFPDFEEYILEPAAVVVDLDMQDHYF
jgi:hypothetical protein